MNNFLNFDLLNKPIDFLELSEKMAGLHLLCFNQVKKHYDRHQMLYFLKNNQNHIFYDEISLAILQVTTFEAELLTLVVHPKDQKNGIGSKLLDLITLYLKDIGIKNLFLEVSVGNEHAIKLYQKIGFQQCGLRKNYYSLCNGTKADASIMMCNLLIKNKKFNKKKLQTLYPTG